MNLIKFKCVSCLLAKEATEQKKRKDLSVILNTLSRIHS